MPAFFSLNHTHISKSGKGKFVQKQAHTSAAHCSYITRHGAATEIMGERMPTTSQAACDWLVGQENNDRKNARIIEKIIIALPRDEMTHAQRAELVRDFAEKVTKGRAPWLAAIHDSERDKDNPHAHIIIRDRDHETGRRVLMASERESTEALRVAWERTCNRHLEALGLDVRIDRRTNEARGIDREAEIHVGPKANAMEEKGRAGESKPREVAQAFGNADGAIIIDYPGIDAGRTRAEANEQIKRRNAAPTARETVTAHARASFTEQQRAERDELAGEHKEMFSDLRRMSNRAAAGEYADQWKTYKEEAAKRKAAEKVYLAKSYKMEAQYGQFNSAMGVKIIKEHRENYRADVKAFLTEERERIFKEQKERADHIYGRAKGFLSSDYRKKRASYAASRATNGGSFTAACARASVAAIFSKATTTGSGSKTPHAGRTRRAMCCSTLRASRACGRT
jgi:hypothetical protein